ncbi:hypothetical protein FRC20_007284 [Serendipita sp. 405]|nr:hypothetical protein FRC20_007284 [Serendipita sp. 405]
MQIWNVSMRPFCGESSTRDKVSYIVRCVIVVGKRKRKLKRARKMETGAGGDTVVLDNRECRSAADPQGAGGYIPLRPPTKWWYSIKREKESPRLLSNATERWEGIRD